MTCGFELSPDGGLSMRTLQWRFSPKVGDQREEVEGVDVEAKLTATEQRRGTVEYR